MLLLIEILTMFLALHTNLTSGLSDSFHIDRNQRLVFDSACAGGPRWHKLHVHSALGEWLRSTLLYKNTHAYIMQSILRTA